MDRFKLMETFIAVAQAGNYTRAASVLGITVAMVSKRMQELEAGLGVRLLNRNTHQLSLTDYGVEYHKASCGMIAELKSIEERIQLRRRAPQGDLRILTTRTFLETVLAPIITAFCAKYPEVSVQVVEMDRALAPHASDLVSGGFDMAIRTLRIRESSLIARALIASPQCLVASPEYLEKHGMPKTPLDLANHNCLDPGSASVSFTWDLHGSGGKKTVRVAGTPRTNSTALVYRATLDGLGISLIRQELVADALADGRLVRVLPNYAIRPKKFFVLYQKDHLLPLRMKLFIEFLMAEVRKTPRKA
ncbi:MAG: LysR family transcriptional regulator [Alphaproteobacteria bacterium]